MSKEFSELKIIISPRIASLLAYCLHLIRTRSDCETTPDINPYKAITTGMFWLTIAGRVQVHISRQTQTIRPIRTGLLFSLTIMQSRPKEQCYRGLERSKILICKYAVITLHLGQEASAVFILLYTGQEVVISHHRIAVIFRPLPGKP